MIQGAKILNTSMGELNFLKNRKRSFKYNIKTGIALKKKIIKILNILNKLCPMKSHTNKHIMQ